jgi:hypothetical protein
MKKIKISEDWLSVIIAFFLFILIWIGVLSKLPWPIIGLFN